MEKILSVLLVEDNPKDCTELVQCIDAETEVSLVGFTNNSNTAIDLVQTELPHAVVLDLELHRGGGNGLLFMQAIKQLELPIYPFILITTNNSSAITYDYARQLGADFIMYKHQSDYSAASVVRFLKMMKDIIITRTVIREPEYSTVEFTPTHTRRVVRMITLELDQVGVSPKSVGYQYLTEAIELLFKNPDMTNLCSHIADKYEKNDFTIERAMQNAINKAWRTSSIDELSKYYTARINSDRGVPTIMEFVSFYAHKIRNQY